MNLIIFKNFIYLLFNKYKYIPPNYKNIYEIFHSQIYFLIH